MEARSALNGVGLVKVMGREAGFIACGATLASQEVNLTLIPEMPFCLEGPDGVLEFLRQRLAARQHAVVVVAEGAGRSSARRPAVPIRAGTRSWPTSASCSRGGSRSTSSRSACRWT